MKTDIMLFHENGKVYYYDMEINKIAIRNIENMLSEGAKKTNKIAAKISKYTVAISLVGISIDRLYRSHTTQGINMIAVISLLSLSTYIIFLVSRFFGKRQKSIDSLEAQTIKLNQKELKEMRRKLIASVNDECEKGVL